jgi:hypothetical protein
VQTKDITDIEAERTSYKVLPLGNDVFVWTVYASLPATLRNPLPFTSNGRGTHRFVPTAVPKAADTNVVKKEAEEILKYRDLLIEIAHVECKIEGDTDNYWCNWKLITIISQRVWNTFIANTPARNYKCGRSGKSPHLEEDLNVALH